MANITCSNTNQIDLIHHTSPKPTSPIIILFCSKRDMVNFYSQYKKVCNLTSEQFKVINEGVTTKETTQGVTSYIYINRSLIQENWSLLKVARIQSKKWNYRHKDDTMTGQVYIKMDNHNDIVLLRSLDDLRNMVWVFLVFFPVWFGSFFSYQIINTTFTEHTINNTDNNEKPIIKKKWKI